MTCFPACRAKSCAVEPGPRAWRSAACVSRLESVRTSRFQPIEALSPPTEAFEASLCSRLQKSMANKAFEDPSLFLLTLSYGSRGAVAASEAMHSQQIPNEPQQLGQPKDLHRRQFEHLCAPENIVIDAPSTCSQYCGFLSCYPQPTEP